MTIPTARIFDSERATGAQAGALAGARFCDTLLESQIQSKIVANDERTVNSVVLHLYAVFISARLSWLEPRSPAGLFVCQRIHRRRLFMAIQDYVRSIAATETVSKDQVFRFLEMQFARADRNHDGELDAEELAAFVLAVARPEADQR